MHDEFLASADADLPPASSQDNPTHDIDDNVDADDAVLLAHATQHKPHAADL